MTITFPWPNSKLNPNARLHWAQLAKAKAAARGEAMYTVKAQMPLHVRQSVSQGQEPIPMTIRFFPPDNRRRDDDNMVASFKALRDGIADALGVDDRRFRPNYVFADPMKPGKIEVEL